MMKNCDSVVELLRVADVIEAEAEALWTIDYPAPGLRGFQGGCSDGERYYYQTLMHYDFASGQEENHTVIVKVDLTGGETVAQSEPLRLHHANDLTYDPHHHRIIVCHNKPHPTRLTLLDADTLTPTGTVELPFAIYSIDYCAARDAYVVGLSGSWDYRFLNADFAPLDDRICRGTTVTARYTKQGVCADENLIYFILWDGKHKEMDDFRNEIAVYDWDGKFRGLIEFDVGVKEPENLSIVNGDILAVCGTDRPILYRLTPKLK